MGNGGLCMGSILTLMLAPTPLGHSADDRLAASLHGDVLDPDHLLALAAVAAQAFEQRHVGPRQPAGGAQVDLPALDGLLRQHGPAMAFEARGVAGDHLADQHAFQFVLRAGADQGSGRRQELPVPLLLVGVRDP